MFTSGLMEISAVSVQSGKVREQSSTSHSAKAVARSRKRSSSRQSTEQSCSQKHWWEKERTRSCTTPPPSWRMIKLSSYTHFSHKDLRCGVWCSTLLLSHSVMAAHFAVSVKKEMKFAAKSIQLHLLEMQWLQITGPLTRCLSLSQIEVFFCCCGRNKLVMLRC